MRLFFAVELPPDVRGHVAEHIARLQEDESGRGARWERVEKLHVTLKFLGETQAARIENLASAARHVAGEFAPFELSVLGAGAFPPRGAARVLWLGIEDASGRLARLQRRLEGELTNESFAPDERRFHPHLTLARLQRASPSDAKRLASAHAEAEFANAPFTVNNFVLMQSELGAKGSRYSVLERFKLEAV
ncbi:MAG: RNA 2',3'-cyclic phosphodiesterase [Pyrinomonadaceae bacterium]|nr:RNA 2',3'-cyclic phosphodiesterase [Pyrinomonadaceae bacterium]